MTKNELKGILHNYVMSKQPTNDGCAAVPFLSCMQCVFPLAQKEPEYGWEAWELEQLTTFINDFIEYTGGQECVFAQAAQSAKESELSSQLKAQKIKYETQLALARGEVLFIEDGSVDTDNLDALGLTAIVYRQGAIIPKIGGNK